VFREDIFNNWLKKEAEKVQTKLEKEEGLTQDDKLVVIIKQQSNHISHLEADLKAGLAGLDQKIINLENKIDDKFDKIYTALDRQTWRLVMAIGALGALIIVFKYVKF